MLFNDSVMRVIVLQWYSMKDYHPCNQLVPIQSYGLKRVLQRFPGQKYNVRAGCLAGVRLSWIEQWPLIHVQVRVGAS